MIEKGIEVLATIDAKILIVPLETAILLSPPLIVCIAFFISRIVDVVVNDGMNIRCISRSKTK